MSQHATAIVAADLKPANRMTIAPMRAATRALVPTWLGLVGTAGAARPARAQQDSLDLAAALALARARSPVVSAANAAVESAEGRLGTARPAIVGAKASPAELEL